MSGLGERLRILRQEAHLSQVALAGDDLSASYVSLIESGRRQPSPDVIALLARRLGCPTSRLAEGPPSWRGRRLEVELSRAELELRTGDPVAACERLGRLVADRRDDENVAVLDTAHLLLAQIHRALGDPARAVHHLLVLTGRADSGIGQPPAVLAERLAAAYLAAGDAGMALTTAQAGLTAAARDGLDPGPEALGLLHTAMQARGALEGAAAVPTARRLLDSSTDLARRDIAMVYRRAADLATQRDRPEEALTLCRLGLVADRDRAAVAAHIERLRHDALAAMLAGSGRTAAREVLAATTSDDGCCHVARAQALLLLGRPAQAAATARRALAEPMDAGAGPAGGTAEAADLHRILGDAAVGQNRPDQARDSYLQAVGVLAGLRPSRAAAAVCATVADRLSELGERAVAADTYVRALDLAGVGVPAVPGARPIRGTDTAAVPGTAAPAADAAVSIDGPSAALVADR